MAAKPTAPAQESLKSPAVARRPRIAICPEFEEWLPKPTRDRGYVKLYHHYYHALTRAGALPFIVPIFEEPEMALELIADADAVVLTGGDDIPAERFNEELHPKAQLMSSWRDSQDALVAKWLLEKSNQPVLAICGGMQHLAVAAGGALLQDIPSLVPHAIEHGRGVRHRISVNRDSRLYKATGGSADVNSYHHQSVCRLGHNQRAVALSEDGIMEAFELRSAKRWLVAVQWHPELDPEDSPNKKLFASFVEAAARFASKQASADLPVILS